MCGYYNSIVNRPTITSSELLLTSDSLHLNYFLQVLHLLPTLLTKSTITTNHSQLNSFCDIFCNCISEKLYNFHLQKEWRKFCVVFSSFPFFHFLNLEIDIHKSISWRCTRGYVTPRRRQRRPPLVSAVLIIILSINK